VKPQNTGKEEAGVIFEASATTSFVKGKIVLSFLEVLW